MLEVHPKVSSEQRLLTSLSRPSELSFVGRTPAVSFNAGGNPALCRTSHHVNITSFDLVPRAGVEPALLSEPDFESGASTSSTTGARELVF